MRNNQYIWETNSKNPDIDLSVTRFENNKLIHFLRQIKDTSIALSQQKAKANDDGVTSAAVVDNNIVSTTNEALIFTAEVKAIQLTFEFIKLPHDVSWL